MSGLILAPPPFVRIANGIVANAASLNFTGLDASFRAYLLLFNDLLPATDNVSLQARVSIDNGASFISAASSYRHARLIGSGGVASAASADLDTKIGVGSALSNNGVTDDAAGFVLIFAPAHAGSLTHLVAGLHYYDNAANNSIVFAGGLRANAEANDAIQFFFSSGNIATMAYTLYGLRKN